MFFARLRNLTDKALREWGVDLCLGGVGKIEPAFFLFFFLFLGAEVANSYQHMFGQDGID